MKSALSTVINTYAIPIDQYNVPIIYDGPPGNKPPKRITKPNLVSRSQRESVLLHLLQEIMVEAHKRKFTTIDQLKKLFGVS